MAELMPEIRVGKSLARSSDHKYLLFWASVAVRCWTWVLVALMSNLPLFDSSPAVLLPDSGKLVTTLLRWDAFHFAHIARKGYEFEYQWAFFPGLPYLMRWTGRLLPGSNNSDLSWEVTLTGGSMFVITLVTSHTLYELSMHHLKSQRLAFLTCLLSLLPTSPPTLYMAPYNEPVFTFLSYKGMLYCARERWWVAGISFALASGFRSNGALLGGFIIWGLVIQPYLEFRKTPGLSRAAKAAALVLAICSPSIIYQRVAYIIFCAGEATPQPSWCHNMVPLIYGYVQAKYWNSGFLLYWVPSQLPNIALAFPVLAVIMIFCKHHFQSISTSILARFKPISVRSLNKHTKDPFLHLGITPHVIHASIMCFVLLFAAHTQIVLRLAASMPLTYWAGAWLLVEHPKWGCFWVGWCLVWGAVSTVLWVAFLPPA